MIQDTMPQVFQAPRARVADLHHGPASHGTIGAAQTDGAAGEGASRRPAYRVLVIEDDPHIARLILVNLTRAGLEARWAGDGMAGLESFVNHPPHIVLLDLMMPLMDGFTVCEKIRAQSPVPIVIMTARLEPIHQMRGFRLGADDYVLKPFDPQLLVARMIAHLRRVYRYDNDSIYRKDDASDENSNAPAARNTERDASATAPAEHSVAPMADVLAHMPAGWAGCGACNYMGPLSQFPRRFNGQDANTLSCPNCNAQGYIKFAVDLAE
jgi:CheY-like chemotaxis protein